MKTMPLTALGVVALLISACTSSKPAASGLGVLPVPEVGETEAGLLDDGHPVFVVHDLDGAVWVVEAVSTHLAEDALAWCRSSRTIDDVAHGARWDARGRYVGGPGATNLGTYDIVVADEDEAVMVVAYVAPSPRSEGSIAAGPDCSAGGYELHPHYDAE